jgi:hypothetical protein
MRFEVVGELGDHALPLIGRLAERGEDCIVQIEQDRGWELGHKPSMRITVNDIQSDRTGTTPTGRITRARCQSSSAAKRKES